MALVAASPAPAAPMSHDDHIKAAASNIMGALATPPGEQAPEPMEPPEEMVKHAHAMHAGEWEDKNPRPMTVEEKARATKRAGHFLAMHKLAAEHLASLAKK